MFPAIVAACLVWQNVFVAVTLVALVWIVRSKFRVPPHNSSPQPTKGQKGDKIVLLEIGGGGNVAGSASPFCVKIEALLRFAELPFTKKDAIPANTPKGKLPVLQHGDDNICDSSLIVKYLEATYGPSFGGKVALPTTAAQRGAWLAAQRVVENHLYHYLLYSRWVSRAGYSWLCANMFSKLPPVVRSLLPPFLRRLMFEQTKYAGVASHAPEDRAAFVEEDLESLDALLGDATYYGGDKPGALDAAVFGSLDQALNGPEVWLTRLVLKWPRLVAFVARVRTKYFPHIKAPSRTKASAGGAGAGAGAGSSKQHQS